MCDVCGHEPPPPPPAPSSRPPPTARTTRAISKVYIFVSVRRRDFEVFPRLFEIRSTCCEYNTRYSTVQYTYTVYIYCEIRHTHSRTLAPSNNQQQVNFRFKNTYIHSNSYTRVHSHSQSHTQQQIPTTALPSVCYLTPMRTQSKAECCKAVRLTPGVGACVAQMCGR